MKLTQLGRSLQAHIGKPILAMLFILTVSLPNAFAQDYTQWHLPDGAKARLGRGAITGNVQYSPDGSLLAVSGSIGVWLYDADTHEEIHSIVFSPDGSTLVSTGRDSRIRLWDIHTEQPKATFAGNIGQIKSLAFSADGRILVSGGRDSTIRLWDVDSGHRLEVLTGHTNTVNTLAFSPDGRTLVSGSEDGTALLWDFTPFVLQIPGDVNSDGVVNIQDLVLVASNFGQTGVNIADVNSDGMVNVQDLVRIASYFEQD